jgi:hypothetical protein
VDKTQFILSIATNIVAAIIIWSWKRFTRKAKSLFVSGTIRAKVSTVLSTKATPIIIASLLLVFDGLLFWRLIIGQSFNRTQLAFACVIVLVSAFWAKQLLNELGFGVVRQLRETQRRLRETESTLAKAETALTELQERQRPRTISNAATALLRGKAIGRVRIVCDPTVLDSFQPLGTNLKAALQQAGWIVEYFGADIPPAEQQTRPRRPGPRLPPGISLESAEIESCERGRNKGYPVLFTMACTKDVRPSNRR